MDWNWFFSSFAQSAAALIAIIGAFIISKLLGEIEKEEISRSNVEHLIIQYNDIKKRISGRYFDWYDKRNIELSSDLAKVIHNGDFNRLSDDEKLKKLFEIETDLYRTPCCLEILNKEIVKKAPRNTPMDGGLTLVHDAPNLNFPPSGIWDELNKEREIINQLKIESETLIEKFEKVKNDINVTKYNLTPIKTTIYILGIGLLLTVIYPLHFIPIELNQSPTLGFSFNLVCSHILSIRGLLLFLLTIVIEGVFGYFLWLIARMKKKYVKTTSKLEEKYFSISDYCQYFN